MPEAPGRVLVVGATGVIGESVVDRFLVAGWPVVAVSRRAPETDGRTPFLHVGVDLRDPDACREAVRSLPDITHVVYAALYEMPGLVAGWYDPEQHRTNLAMLRNILDPVAERGTLRHVTLMQGAKAYGGHVHPTRLPSKEREPRDDHPNAYWLQEDHVRLLAERHDFATTLLRPQLVLGRATGVAMNVVPVIGAYAALCRELGEACGFPGGRTYVWEAVDARLLGGVCVWAATAPAAVGETFNVTNGDVFGWRDLWPSLMDELGVEVGADQPRRLATWLPQHAPLWDRIVERHGLRAPGLPALLGESHHYTDRCFAYGEDGPAPLKLLSTIKLRQAGFSDCLDTEASFRYWLRLLVSRKVLPT